MNELKNMTTVELACEMAMGQARMNDTREYHQTTMPKDAEERYLAAQAELANRFLSGWVMTGNKVSHEGRIS